MGFGNCVFYLVLTGTACFVLGRIIPKNWFAPERFPFRGYAFENEGKIYEKLHIRKWQNKVPDMSKVFPWLMPAKNLSGAYAQRLSLMVRETCVAEFIHYLTALSGLYCPFLWPGPGGITLMLLNAILLNLPFILIQRYNRPRLMRLEKKLLMKRG